MIGAQIDFCALIRASALPSELIRSEPELDRTDGKAVAQRNFQEGANFNLSPDKPSLHSVPRANLESAADYVRTNRNASSTPSSLAMGCLAAVGDAHRWSVVCPGDRLANEFAAQRRELGHARLAAASRTRPGVARLDEAGLVARSPSARRGWSTAAGRQRTAQREDALAIGDSTVPAWHVHAG